MTAGTDDVSMEGEAFRRLLALPQDEPCWMLNLLRFHDQAQYQPGDPEYGEPPVSGAEAYRRYGLENRRNPLLPPGERMWLGDPKLMLIGPADEVWHLAFVRNYLTLRSFVDLISSPEYRLAARHRRAAVADSRLILNGASNF